jgi:hypothetical protein
VNICKTRRARKGTFIIGIGFILFQILTMLCPCLFAADELDVKKDKDKTVYTIGSSDDNRKEEAKERDKAWDMLNKMPVIIDRRTGQPATTAPAQPAPAR